MEDDIDVLGQFMNRVADRFPHAALDQVSLMRLAQDFAGGKADAGSGADGRRVWDCRSYGEKPAHGGRELLAGSFVDSLIVGVLA